MKPGANMATRRSSTEEALSSMSRAVRKPLMEKRRRARMNDSLEALRELLAAAGHVQGSPQGAAPPQPARLDKADILELTVHLVRRLLADHASPGADTTSTKPWRPW